MKAFATAALATALALAPTFESTVRDAGIVGGSLLVVQRGQGVAHTTAGYQDLDRKVPVSPETIFHWASITKTFTGIAIMQLRDRGLLTLDTPAVKFIPELRGVHSRFGDIEQVTIRTLMQHSAGFRASTWPWGGSEPWHPFEPASWSQLAAMLPYTELLFKPGAEYRYSNPGVVFLGRIIEIVSGEDFEVYVTKNILMPLGMHRTFFDRAPYHLLAHRSHSYVRVDGDLSERPFDFDTGITVSNGGLNAPLPDMGRYLQFLLNEPERPEHATVLSRRSLEEMWVPSLTASDGEGGSGTDVRIGLSFFVERYGDITLVGHSGDQNGFISHLYVHPPSHTAWVVNFNTDVTTKGATRSHSRAADDSVRDMVIAEFIRR